jgi:hypothetical protein
MRRLSTGVCLVLFVLASTVALAQGFKRISEFLVGYQEVPAVSTAGNGEFHARISNDESEIEYQLSYSDLEGNVTQSHIHLGQRGVNGGIMVFLCTNLGNGPAGTQACPAPPATITGTIRAANIGAGAAAQGITPGEMDELIRALRAGVTYVNIHSTLWPGGEVRSQIDGNSGREH